MKTLPWLLTKIPMWFTSATRSGRSLSSSTWGGRDAYGMVEQREAAHEPREILGVHAAPALQRTGLDEVRVRVDPGRRDIGIAAQVIRGIKHFETLQPADGRLEQPSPRPRRPPARNT